MKLLLAEDEKSLSRAVASILRKNHYEVDTVFNGTDALAYLEASAYDGVILDLMMPGLDGIGVLKTIRKEGITTPVLILTAKSEIEDKVLGLDSGANDYLTKPFDVQELLARIRAMTRSQNSGQASSELKFGNVVLNQATFELSSPKGSFRLSGREYQMMEMLMRNPRQVISKEQFMEKIWGYDSDADVGVIWVYISYLRKKLKALDADIRIRASRSIGYSLETAA